MGCGKKKKLSVSVAVPPAPVRVTSQRPLAPSVVSVTSVPNDKDVNEMILGAVHRSPGIERGGITYQHIPKQHNCSLFKL